MTSEATAPPDLRSLPLPYPKTDRQAEFMALADRLAASAAERAAEHDREGTFPFETVDELKASGYPALTVPEEYGGRGADPLELALAQERLARGDGSVGLGSWMHLGLVARQATTRTWPASTFERVGAAPAVLLGDGQGRVAARPQLVDALHREGAFAVVLGGVGAGRDGETVGECHELGLAVGLWVRQRLGGEIERGRIGGRAH